MAAGLEHVGHRAPALHAQPPVNAEDRADRGIDVDVGRAVEGIEEDRVFADGAFGRDRDDVFVFLRSHDAHPTGVFQAILDRLVRQHVQLLLLLALHVLGALLPQDVDQPGSPDRRGDDLGRQRDVVQQIGQLPGGLGVLVFLIENEPLDGRDRRLHEAPGYL